MQHVVMSTMELQHFDEGTLLSSVMIMLGSVIVGTALLLSTWQRSLSSSLSIQGAASGFPFAIFDFANMESKDDDKKIPTFDGKLDSYREYRRRALLFYHGMEDSKQVLAAPRLIAALSGGAFECFRERDPADFRTADGIKAMLAILDSRYQYTPEQELSEWLEMLLYKIRRQAGEETTAFTSRFETTLLKAEELMTEELRQERRRQAEQARAEFRRQSLDYMVASQQHLALISGLAEGATAPPAPVPPAPPADLPPVVPFKMPEVMKGFLYLRHVGISLQTRASLLRSAGGSLRYDKVSELLRKTELDALIASRGTKAPGHGFYADLDEGDYGQDNEDEYEDDEADYGDFGGYAEDDEEEDYEDYDDDPVDEAPDEEYDTAMVGYLEARKKFMQLRKSRGFQDPEQQAASKKPDNKPRHPRRGDFQWRPTGTTSSSRSTPSTSRPSSSTTFKGHGHGRGKGKKPKGQGRRKGSGKRGSSSRRGDPNGSQYLGWASETPPTAPPLAAQQAMMAEFQPEFSFMAYTTSSSLAQGIEEEVSRCLAWDQRLNLELEPARIEQACLAVPPGHAIVDTGCTSTLVGSESESQWNAELAKQSGGSLKAERGPSDVKFEGINGEAKASYQVKYPVCIGGKDGFVKASVIPGRAPFLLSIQALRQMKAKLDCECDTLTIPGIGCIQLSVNAVGHYLLPMFDFHKQPRPPPGLEHGMTAATQAESAGPEDECGGEAGIRQGVVGVDLNPKIPPTHPPGSDVLTYQPCMKDVSKRSDKLAKTVLLRLSKDTKGPWIQLPQELAAVHLILGKHGFISPDVPWQIRSAQIGYRSKIIRRPPPILLREAFVLVMSLGDKTFGVFKDWTECSKCAGQPLGSEASSARMFLFVFATRPQNHALPVHPVHVSSETGFAASHGAITEAAKLPQILEESDSEFVSCDETLASDHERVPMRVEGVSRSTGVCARRLAPRGDVLQRPWPDLALRHLPPLLQGVPRADGQVGPVNGRDDLQPSEGLQLHCNSGAEFSCRLHATRHRGPDSRRRRGRYPAQEQECPVPVRHPEGDDESVSGACEGAAPITNGGSRVEHFEIFGQCGSDTESSSNGDSGSGASPSHRGPSKGGHQGATSHDCQADSRWICASGTDHGPHGDHGRRQGDDQPRLRCAAPSRDAGRDDGEVSDRPGCRARGPSSRVVDPSSLASTTSRATSCDCRLHASSGNLYASNHSEGSDSHGPASRRGSRGALRPRFFGWLGASVAALVSSCADIVPVPPSVHPVESVEETVQDTEWPRLSPEVGCELPVLGDLKLPTAWKASETLDMSKRATRAQVKQWLGPQAWKLDRGIKVGLVEVFTGRGRLSDAHEQMCDGSEAIRLGHMYGQELRTTEGQWLTLSLIDLCKPEDVYVSFPCRGWRRWSTFNERRGPLTRRRILQDRVEGRKDLGLLFQILDRQSLGRRHTHAENPRSSLAWASKQFERVSVPHGYVTFDQCALNLRHPQSNRPIRKSTTIFTTKRSLAAHMSQFKCKCVGEHDAAEGSFRGRSVTSWCEDNSRVMAEALISGMHPNLLAEEVFTATLHYDERITSNPVERCFVGIDQVIHKSFPAEATSSGEPQVQTHDNPADSSRPDSQSEAPATVFKITDRDMCKQLTLLQFPGRYAKLDLPVPVQTQLRAWSGMEVNTMVTSARVKCFVNPPVGVVANRRTTLARSGGDWYYVEFNKELSVSKKKFRLPLNANAVVTFFGDAVSEEAPVPAEVQPREQPLPGAPREFSDARKVHDYLNRLHVGLGHPGDAEFMQHLKDAGAAPWLLQQASRFRCAVCAAQKPPAAHSVVGGPKPRSFNSILSIDTLDLTLVRGSTQHRVFLLTAIDTATSFARVFLLPSGDAEAAIQSLKRGWIESYGAPEYIYADPDTIFRSENFAAFLTRYAIVERLSAAQAPFQHGQIERFHRTLRQQAQRVFESDSSCSAFEAAVEVTQARNELMRVEGVSPAVLVFGKLPKAPPSMAEGDEDFRLLAERLQRSDPLYEVMMLRRVAARTAWVQSEVRDRTSRVMSTRSRPYKGPYYPGQVVLVYRRRRGDAANPGRHGVWLGPGEVIAVESTNDRLVPRVVYVTVHGRLFLCSPEQLRPVSVRAEWVMKKLQEDGLAPQRNSSDTRRARGVDVRNERPSSAELEQEYEVPEGSVVLEELKGEAEYDPYPQAPPTVPGTPAPGTPAPGTPRPGTPRPATPSPEVVGPSNLEGAPLGEPSLGSIPADETPTPTLPENEPTPQGGDVLSSLGSAQQPSGGTLGDRGHKRPPDFHQTVEQMSYDRSVQGPRTQVPVPRSAPATGSTVHTGQESQPRGRSRSPPPREGSYLSFSDFPGLPSDHPAEAWFTESPDHDYDGVSIGLSFDVDLDEIRDELSICHLVREMALNASIARKRAIEVNERRLSPEEKSMFRAAKAAEWSQWVSNDVVELISRYGVDPKRIIASRWVLTWKSVPGEDHGGPDGSKAKARLVIRGFADPDLGKFSTASPTLSRQGRHAILTVASHLQYRLFTLDAKTAFLAGDTTSRTKPIYTELPKDLVQDQGYGPDMIARIKKVPYGLSEAPLAWYRRLTSELEACGFEQVPSDKCIYVLRRGGEVLGVIGAHVDDLLVAGCSPSVDSRFEEAMAKLVARLPFGERKYADLAPVLYTGLNVRQHPQTRSIVIDQAHYVAKLKEVPTRKLPEGLLDRDGQTQFWSQLGALLWVAVNTRPDVAYDVSHFASYGSRPEKQHLVSLNKIVRTLQSCDYSITFSKVVDSWDQMTLVVFSDAGHTSRPSGHSQSGTVTFWAPREVLDGQEVRAVLADYSSCKIDRAVWSSYASELQAATISTDSAVNLLLLYEQVFFGLKARDVKSKITDGRVVRALVTDNKGLYDSIQTEKPSTRQGVKMQSLVYQILFDVVNDYAFQTYWVNGAHMLADGLTKLSSSGAQVDAIRRVLQNNLIRITYCTVSGRKEQSEVRKLTPLEPVGKELRSSIDI